jgi:diguanylate cyclase (GGDEF)-like protein
MTQPALSMGNEKVGATRDLGEDAFLPYRERIVYLLTLVSLLVFMPFVVNSHIQGRYALEACLLVFVLIVGLDAWAHYRGRKFPIPLYLLLLPVLGGFTLTVLDQHYIGLVWAYPVVALFFFILPRRMALIAGVITIATIAGLMLATLEFRYTSRVVASLSLVAVLAYIFVTKIESLHRRVLAQSLTDPLTGAYNRRHLSTVLKEAYERSKRGVPLPALLAMDIDHFKRINDQLGHAAGDEVLKALVEVIRARIRTADSLFRTGGEEFVLFLPETSNEGAAIVAEALRQCVAESRLYDDWPVTVSMGVSTLHREGDSVDAWLTRGDKALYHAKQSGRNRVVKSSELPLETRHLQDSAAA